MPNPSPFLNETIEPPYTGIESAPHFDLGQVDTSMKVDIDMELFKLKFSQTVFAQLFEILNNNVMHEDDFTQEFSNALQSLADDLPEAPKAKTVTK
jgi:hypothetical protein